MSNDKSLVIVESAQYPQVVVSSVSAVEIEFQGTLKEYNAALGQVRQILRPLVDVKERLIHAWLAENYPEVPYTLSTKITDTYECIAAPTTIIIESPRGQEIFEEISEYLAHLER